MAFRADEAATTANESAKNYLIGRRIDDSYREHSEDAFWDIVDQCGPAVESYPTWHPLVSHHEDRNPVNYPCNRNGYHGLDHTKFFAHGFVTCPYDDGQSVIDSVNSLPRHPCADITAERLEVKFYDPSATPVLVKCRWHMALEIGKLVPKRIAVPLMLEQEIPMWRWSKLGERWETMRPYYLGEPHGKRSSLFVSQETALAMKKVHNAMVESGMFGPLRMD